VVILVLVVLLLYLVLPLVMESLIAWRLQTAFGTPTKPAVEVSSNFPPMMLLGRFDSVQVRMDQASLQGATLYNTRADLAGKPRRGSIACRTGSARRLTRGALTVARC
jgi:hypothetical protein